MFLDMFLDKKFSSNIKKRRRQRLKQAKKKERAKKKQDKINEQLYQERGDQFLALIAEDVLKLLAVIKRRPGDGPAPIVFEHYVKFPGHRSRSDDYDSWDDD